MKTAISIILFSFFPLILFAQQKVSLTGSVFEEESTPLAYANAILMDKNNPGVSFGTTTGQMGEFTLSAPASAYLLELSFLGYEKQLIELDLLRDTVLPPTRLVVMANEIESVTVVARSIVHNTNGYALNVSQNAAFKGFDLHDMLAMCPGIIAQGEGLTVYGKDIAKVYVNDRELNLSGDELNQYLRTIGSENVRKIEVITSSGVEDDAQAMGGRILKITTKTSGENGGNLSAAFNYTLMNARSSYTPRINFNLRQGKFSTYLRANYNYSENKSSLHMVTEYYDPALVRDNDFREGGKTPYRINGVWGVGYDFNPRNLVTLEASYSRNKYSYNSSSETENRYASGSVDHVRGDLTEEDSNERIGLSGNYVYKAPNDGRLLIRADWLNSKSNQEQDQNYLYVEDDRVDVSRQHVHYERDIVTVGADYSQPFRGDKDKLETGAKWSYFSSANTTAYANLINDSWVEDPDYTDLYDYDENVYALYAKYSMGLGKFSLSGGLRMEHSRINPFSRSNPERNHKSHYTDFFPEAALNYAFGKDDRHMVSARYKRSLTRPPFSALNPYKRPSSSYSYFIGNPYLGPEYANRFELSTTLWGKYTLLASYMLGKGSIAEVIFKDPDSDIIYSQQQNIGTKKEVSVFLQIPVQLYKWWRWDLSGNYGYQSIAYAAHKRENNYILLNAQTTLQLPAKFNLVISGNWFNRYLMGNMLLTGPFTMNVNLNKSLLKDRLVLTFSANDLLNRDGRMKIESSDPDFVQTIRKRGNFRIFSFAATCNFRWGKKIRVSRLESGNEEERSRE